MTELRPTSAEEAAIALAGASRAGRRVRLRGGGTKLGWGRAVGDLDLSLSTVGLDRLVEHSPGDLTAVVEAGMPLRRAQEVFATSGQMLSLDPPLGAGDGATLGGILATADSGPLRHRYGAARDLVLGARVALSDGTLARSGGKVIKNVAGYDLPKLLTGSFGTLGLLVEVAVRLHPVSRQRATVVGSSDSPGDLQRAALALAEAPLEADCLDLTWRDGAGAVLVRFAGLDPGPRCGAATGILARVGVEARVVEDDDALWGGQREAQRDVGGEGAVVRVSALSDRLASVVEVAAALGASAVARAALGPCWIRLPAAPVPELARAVGELRRRLAPLPCVVLDGPAALRAELDPFGELDPVELRLMRRVKERFDPTGTCNPGLFAGGI